MRGEALPEGSLHFPSSSSFALLGVTPLGMAEQMPMFHLPHQLAAGNMGHSGTVMLCDTITMQLSHCLLIFALDTV